LFQMQQDAIKEGQKVLIVDDIIATGKNPRQDGRQGETNRYPSRWLGESSS
jgi:hypothetical protein